jgi:hypothetical protein
MTAAPDYMPAMGTYTDIAVLEYEIPGANLSCGYYNAHSDDEYLDLAEFAYTNSIVPALAEIDGTFEVPKAPVKKVTVKKSADYTGYYNSSAWDDYDDYYGYGYGDGWATKGETEKLTDEKAADKASKEVFSYSCPHVDMDKLKVSGECVLCGTSYVPVLDDTYGEICCFCAETIIASASKDIF